VTVSMSPVRLSVRLSVSVPFRYRDHIGRNTYLGLENNLTAD